MLILFAVITLGQKILKRIKNQRQKRVLDRCAPKSGSKDIEYHGPLLFLVSFCFFSSICYLFLVFLFY